MSESDTESDIEIRSALPKMIIQKPPESPSEDIKTKKITTKTMIVDALIELKTRKGVSLYAIKKHLTEKYEVNTDKVNYLIKKTIKAGVEDGTFVQMKGIGAAGSFKLANIKEKPKTMKKPAKPKQKKEKTKEKPTISPEKKKKKLQKKAVTKTDDNKTKQTRKPKKMEIKKTDNMDVKKENKVKKVKKTQEKEEKQETEERKKKKVKIAKGMPTPAKKRSTMMKRKSIGSIIKPPKMKPKKV